MRSPWLWMSIAAVFIVAFAALSFIHFSEKPSVPAGPLQFQITPPVRLAPGGSFALSPDGRNLAFAGVGPDRLIRLWIRELGSLEVRPLSGTESTGFVALIWSPDSRFLAFDAGGMLKKIDISSGPPQIICDISGSIAGGSWNRDGVIIFGDYLASNRIMRVSATGGIVSPVTSLNPAQHETGHFYPTFLPDGKNFLYLSDSGAPESRTLNIGSLDFTPEEQKSKRLSLSTSGPAYVPSQDSGPGYLLSLRGQILVAQPFDEKRLEMLGDQIPIAEHLGYCLNFGFFSASTNGILIYRSGTNQLSQCKWFDRQGKTLGEVGEPGLFFGLALSPDKTRAAVGWHSEALTATDVWLVDFSAGTHTRFTHGRGNETRPIWSPDGSRILFASSREGVYNLCQKPAGDATEEDLLLKSSENKFPTSWSNDSRFILYTAFDPNTQADLWVLPLGNNRNPAPFLHTEFNETDGRFSPDMRWIAYQSDESGGYEIYVRGFLPTSGEHAAETGDKWLISVGGGMGPRWRGDGKELYYFAPDGKVMAVEVIADREFRAGTPKPLFQAPPDISLLSTPTALCSWDVAEDGNRFLLPTPVAESSSTPFTVIANWTSLLKK